VRSGAELGLPGWARITVGPEPLMDRVAAALPEVLTEVRRIGAPT
jgi:histidinol-phosphate/aromatic aminotransferase/cobyric acid decarboxylase-like protein